MTLLRVGVLSVLVFLATSAAQRAAEKQIAPPADAQPEISVVLNHGRPSRPTPPVPFPDIKDWNSLRITLVRGVCFGTCPAYEVEIRGDGSVTYRGREFVAVTGEHHWHVSQRTVRKLFEAFRGADYFNTFDNYTASITDGPAYQTSIVFDGHRKVVGDYIGEAVGMPGSISRVEDAIDEAAGTLYWVNIAPQTIFLLDAEDYFKKPEKDTSVLVSMIAAGATLDQVTALLAMGASPNGWGLANYETSTPLEAAAAGKNRDKLAIMRALLAAGADPSAKSSQGTSTLDEICADQDERDACQLARNWRARHP